MARRQVLNTDAGGKYTTYMNADGVYAFLSVPPRVCQRAVDCKLREDQQLDDFNSCNTQKMHKDLHHKVKSVGKDQNLSTQRMMFNSASVSIRTCCTTE
jgi:hypothetical protein